MEVNKEHFYILVGEKGNWDVSLKENLWGFTERSKGLWNTTKINELLAFYVTSPTKKIIGFGKVTDKFVNEDLIWHDEKIFKRSLWKYKISFKVFHICDNSEHGVSVPKEIMLNTGRKVVDKKMFLQLIKEADSKWKTTIFSTIENYGKELLQKK